MGAGGTGFQVDTATMRGHSEVLSGHAQTARAHAANFTAKVSGMSFR